MTENATDPIERCRRTLGEMSDLVGNQGHTTNTRRWDRLVGDWLSDRRELEQSEDGRAAIAALMTDERPAVRLWAAAAVLFWDPDAARPVLDEIRDQPIRYDMHSITAKQTMLAFEAGTLDRDAPLPGT